MPDNTASDHTASHHTAGDHTASHHTAGDHTAGEPAVDRPLRADRLPEPATPLEAATVDLLVDIFTAYPTWGTAVGYHSVDARWPDLSEEGRIAHLGMLRDHATRLATFDEAALAVEERLDRAILLEAIDHLVFSEEVLREHAWDALATVYLLGSGLFGILARDYAPWAERGAALLARVEGLPAVTHQALVRLTGMDGRPVSLLHLDTALAQLAGVDDLIANAVSEADRRALATEAPDLPDALRAAASVATAALADLRLALDTDVRARAAGDGRLGPELFRQKLRHTLGSDTSPEALRSRAWAHHAAVRAQMLRLARELWPEWLPGEPLPDVPAADTDAEGRLVRRVLDAIAADHQRPETLIDFCQSEMGRIEAFCRERDVIELPDEPMVITWTPVFLRAYGRAFLDSPGPLDRGQRAEFWITPPDPASGSEAVESHLREENDRGLRLLCIHEGIPGHYLQLARSNRCRSLARTVFVNGMFAEGWAVYVEQVMLDMGYGAEDRALQLAHWKFYLRAVTNAILDVETHAGSLTESQAMDLMVHDGFQEEDEARAKWLRARITATQLSTYFVGSLEMWDLEVAARRRAAAALGADPSAVPAQRIAGGLGETPGFDQRSHLEAVISHGSPAIKWLPRFLLGDESADLPA